MMGKKIKKKKKIKIKNPKRLLIFFSIIIIIMVAIGINKNSIKVKENMSLIINNEDVTSKLQDEIIVKDNVQYLSLNDIKKCIDSNIYMEDKKIITTSDKKVAKLELDSNKIEINGTNLQLNGKPYKAEQGTIYIPISDLKNVYDMDFLYVAEYKNMVIDSYSQKLEKAVLTKNVLIKEEPKSFASNIERLKKDDSVIYISEQKGWAKVRTQNGNLGYVKKSKLKNFSIEREAISSQNKKIENASFTKDISKEKIEKYEDRKSLTEKILVEAVNKKQKTIKILYKKDTKSEAFQRFKVEATAFLKECGITVVYE